MFANKQDLPNALSVSELTDKLGLHALRNKTVSILNRNILPTPAVKVKSACTELHLYSPFHWLTISCPCSGTLSQPAPPRALGCMRVLTGYPKSFPRTNEGAAGHTRRKEGKWERETERHRTTQKAQTFKSRNIWSSSTNVLRKDKAGGQLNHHWEIFQFLLLLSTFLDFPFPLFPSFPSITSWMATSCNYKFTLVLGNMNNGSYFSTWHLARVHTSFAVINHLYHS